MLIFSVSELSSVSGRAAVMAPFWYGVSASPKLFGRVQVPEGNDLQPGLVGEDGHAVGLDPTADLERAEAWRTGFGRPRVVHDSSGIRRIERLQVCETAVDGVAHANQVLDGAFELETTLGRRRR